MDIQLAVQKVEERFDYEGNELSTLKPSHNSDSPKCRCWECDLEMCAKYS
jgi:hypothetical protein